MKSGFGNAFHDKPRSRPLPEQMTAQNSAFWAVSVQLSCVATSSRAERCRGWQGVAMSFSPSASAWLPLGSACPTTASFRKDSPKVLSWLLNGQNFEASHLTACLAMCFSCCSFLVQLSKAFESYAAAHCAHTSGDDMNEDATGIALE